MKRLCLVVLVATAALSAAQVGPAKTSGVLAIVGQGTNARLGYVDPVTLKFVGRSTQVGYYSRPSARSPDGSRLALARAEPGGVRIMDLRRLRTVTAFKLQTDNVAALAWVQPRLLLAAVGGSFVDAIDPVARRVLWQKELPTFGYDDVAHSANGLVFLSSPVAGSPDAIGPTTLTVVGSAGGVRSVVLDRILTGINVPESGDWSQATRRAVGLAVDVAGNRAFVVGAGEPIAEVDLGTLAVTYHGGTRTLAKVFDGPVREAAWLPNGTIAVTGYDGDVSKDANGNLTESETPAGLVLVNTRDWSTRMVDKASSSMTVSGGQLVTYSWFANAGLGVYGLDGTPRLHAFQGPVQNVELGGGMAFAQMTGDQGLTLLVVDLSSGHVVNSFLRKSFAIVGAG